MSYPKHKVCTKCKKSKPITGFYKSVVSKDRLHSYCKVCHKKWNDARYKEDKDKILAGNKRWADQNPLKRRDIQLRYSYGITLEDYNDMFDIQKGVCKICGSEPRGVGKRALAVDHCHETGKVRGLLCVSCNTLLGKIESNPSLLENIKFYLDNTGKS